MKKLLTNQITCDIIYTERGKTRLTRTKNEREIEQMKRTLKAYKNVKTLEVVAGYGSRKYWKQIKEYDGKPSDWKRIDPKGWY